MVLATNPSSSNPTKTYQIRLGHDRRVYCTCPSWKFSKGDHKTCKHLRAYETQVIAAKSAPMPVYML